MRRLAILAAVLVGAAVLAGWLRRFQRWAIAGESMLPTFTPGDWLLVERLRPGVTPPPAGAIVLVADPRDPSLPLLKRITRFDAEGKVWIEGDNPPHSTDSRHFGPVPVTSIMGVVRFRYWPLNRTGRTPWRGTRAPG